MLEHLTVEVFEPHIGESFWVQFPNETKVELRLTSAARTMESEAAKLPRHPFSLTFVGPGSFQLRQQIYSVAHDTLGTYEIFLVPVGHEGDLYTYEAVFA